jgi:hypothetical protein
MQLKGKSSSSSEKAVRVVVLESGQPSRLVGPGTRVGPVVPGVIRELSVPSKNC